MDVGVEGKLDEKKGATKRPFLYELNRGLLHNFEFIIEKPSAGTIFEGNFRADTAAVGHFEIFDGTDFT